jgi:tetratricopeptide (TPR) repeat protein
MFTQRYPRSPGRKDMKTGLMGVCFGIFFFMIAAGLAERVAAAETPGDLAQALPSKALISGVPYVSWSEAAQLRYEQKNIVNPSIVAAHKMIRKYWGQDRSSFLRFGPEEYLSDHWKDTAPDTATGLADLKSWLARGVPVYVTLPLTPHAHPDWSGGLAVATAAAPAERERRGPSSKGLGRWGSLQALLQQGGKHSPQRKHLHFWHTGTAAARVVIGYDDERKVMILHEPSFGPASEIGYDDFERMWQYNELKYMARPPQDYVELVARRRAADTYPARTPDMHAALHYALGYGYSEIGKGAEAEREFEKGLALPGIGNGYRHVLSYELAHHRRAAGRTDDAIALLRQAIDALPEAPGPYTLLSEIYRSNPSLPGAPQAAAEVEQAWKSRFNTSEGMRIAMRTFPRDFHIVAVAPYRGWACEPDFRGSRC